MTNLIQNSFTRIMKGVKSITGFIRKRHRKAFAIRDKAHVGKYHISIKDISDLKNIIRSGVYKIRSKICMI